MYKQAERSNPISAEIQWQILSLAMQHLYLPKLQMNLTSE